MKHCEVWKSSDGFLSIYEEGTEVAREEVVGPAIAGPRTVVARDVSERYAETFALAPELLDVVRAMVADEAFKEFCQGVGGEPQWLKDGRDAVSKTEGVA